jgi:hypothetical protein
MARALYSVSALILLGKNAVFARREAIQCPSADTVPYQAQGRITHRRRHAPHLTIAALAKSDIQPCGRYAGAVTDRWCAWPDRRGRYQFDFGGSGHTVVEQYAFAQAGDGLLIRFA